MKRLFMVVLCVLALMIPLTACSSKAEPKLLRISTWPKQDYIVGADEQEFLDSLDKAYVRIRDVREIDSDPIVMSDARFEVSGFSSLEPGYKHIFVRLKENKDIFVQFTVTIVPISPKSFKITTLPGEQDGEEWVEFSYPTGVKPEEIDLSGGMITITNNDGSANAAVAMTEENVEVISVTPFSTEGGANLLATVTVKLVGTTFVETFTVSLIEAPTEPAIPEESAE